MKVDVARIRTYLREIKSNLQDIEEILQGVSEEALVRDKIKMKALKYSLVEIAEAMANVLQHFLAKGFGKFAEGYLDTVKKASETGIISEALSESILPFLNSDTILFIDTGI